MDVHEGIKSVSTVCMRQEQNSHLLHSDAAKNIYSIRWLIVFILTVNE